MAYQSAPIDALLDTAIGEDPMLMRDLRFAFRESAENHVRALTVAASVSEWHMAAWRFKGLCASFGLEELGDLATLALERPHGDPAVLRRITRAMATFADD
jgi:HPt (histidine-containing phosphotransfer) domain-containing protein